jgi:hypothetical protein
MALQSQTLRSSPNLRSSESLSRTRRHGQKRMVGVVLLVLCVGGGFVYLMRSRDGGPNPLGPQSARADGVTLPGVAPVQPAPEPVQPPKPEPVVLEMGGKARPGPTVGAVPRTSPSQAPQSTAQPQAPASGQLPLPLPHQSPAAQQLTDTSGLPGELAAAQSAAERAIAEKKPVEARAQLNKILVDPRVSEKDREGIRRWMADLNKDLVFSANAYPGDPLVDTYKVVSGDNPIKISRKVNSVTEAGFIQRVNNVSPSALQVGQQLKIVKGPFHAVVSKSQFRLDIFAGPTPPPSAIGTSPLGAGAEPGWTYIRSFNVGLGKDSGTPLGAFMVKEGSKLVNPPWVNPRTGEKFGKDDPKNPLGERWIGLLGIDEKTKQCLSYGIHATIEPDSIGKELSMGCVRMAEEDVDLVYELLMGRVSVVKIVP